ncbi:hypothetical protein [Mycobacterium sp. MMS18-G62]
MPKCPNGHSNPKDQQLCQECDALIISSPKRLSNHTLWIILSTSVVAAVLLAAILGVVVMRRSGTQPPSTPTAGANAMMQQWWSSAHEHFDELQSAVSDSQQALKRQDDATLQKSCQVLHDAGTVKLRAHLPAPDPDLTAELDAAINDAHDAAHMCLSAISGSQNNYAGEFVSNLDQAEMHLKAALDIVNKGLLTA